MRLVVRGAVLGGCERLGPVRAGEPEVHPFGLHEHRRLGRLFVEPDGGLDRVHHRRRRFEAGDLGVGLIGDGIRAARATGAGQLGDRRRLHAVLPERGQHVGDVVEIRAVRAHEQQVAAAVPDAGVRVQQVCRPVQSHHRLARARPAVDHEGATGVGADDRVLIGLDGGQHIPHPAGPRPAQAGEERRLLVQARAGGRVAVVAQDLVPEIHDPPARPPVPPPVRHAHRVGERRGEERLRGRGPPVHEQGRAGGIEQADAADVHGIGLGRRGEVPDAQVEAEAAERGQLGGHPADIGVAFDRLRAGAGRVAAARVQSCGQAGDLLRERAGEGGEVPLVGGDERRIGLGRAVVGEGENAGVAGEHRASVHPHRGLAARPPTSYKLRVGRDADAFRAEA